jgi:hypothetical protein
MRKGSRRRAASKSSGEENEAEEVKVEDQIDEATRREIEFKVGKKEGLLNEWLTLQKEAETNLLQDVVPIQLSPEEREDVQTCVHKIFNSQPLEPVEMKYIVKALGSVVDGNRLTFAILAEKIGKQLAEAGVLIEEGSSNMKLLDYLAQKEEVFRKCPSSFKVSPCPIFELRELEMFKVDDDLGGLYDKQSVRRKTMNVLEKLAAYILALEQAKFDQRSLSLIDSCERKYTSAKTKLTQETVSKTGLLGIQNKGKPTYQMQSQKEPKLAPNNQASKDYAKRAMAAEHPLNKSASMDEAKGRASAIANEQPATAPQTNTFITNFFNIKPTSSSAALQTQKPAQPESIPNSIFRRALGSIRFFAEFPAERKSPFDKLFKSKTRHVKSPTLASLKQDLLDKLKKPKSQPNAEGVPQASEGRQVFIKYEDHLFNSYGFRGKFGKQSAAIAGRRPLARDEQRVDYDLDSDEELEDLNGESIHSEDKDEEDEEDDLDPEDGFVVADGYFSDEEVNGSLDEEERSSLFLREN